MEGYIAAPSGVGWASICIQESLRDNGSFWFLEEMKDLDMN